MAGRGGYTGTMHDTHNNSPLRRGLMRVLNGAHPWGSIDVLPDRFGITRYRLVVFPPGISEPERRRVRMARGWVLWAALVWVVCEVWLTQVTGPLTAFAVSTAAFAGVGLTATAFAGAQRMQVRTMAVTVSVGDYAPAVAAMRDKLEALALTLIEADERLARGQISAADHELTWWHVYNEIGTRTAA